MADENKAASVNTPKASTPSQQHQSGEELLHVELLSTAWMEPQKDGSFKRWHQGDKLDIPASLYDRLGDGNHFKPSFRKVEKDV